MPFLVYSYTSVDRNWYFSHPSICRLWIIWSDSEATCYWWSVPGQDEMELHNIHHIKRHRCWKRNPSEPEKTMICEPANISTHAKGTILMTPLLKAAQGVALSATLPICMHMVILNMLVQIIFSHYSEVIMGTLVSQITSLTTVCSTVCLGVDKRKHQSSASLAFVRGPVMRKMFSFDKVIMLNSHVPDNVFA